MSEKENALVERLASTFLQMTEHQQEVFLARGEGYRDGYRDAKRDMSASTVQQAAPG